MKIPLPSSLPPRIILWGKTGGHFSLRPYTLYSGVALMSVWIPGLSTCVGGMGVLLANTPSLLKLELGFAFRRLAS